MITTTAMLTWNMCKYFSDSDKYFSATHPAHNLRVLEDLLLDHGEAALHEGSVSSRVPRHAFILHKKSNQNRSDGLDVPYADVSYVHTII